MDASDFQIGTMVRVLPDHHRAGELATVVRANVPAPPWGTVALSFPGVSGGPLWYHHDEVEPVYPFNRSDGTRLAQLMADGHYRRHGHALRGYYVPSGTDGVLTLVRTCCPE